MADRFNITRLSTKGQLIIPLEVRQRHGWRSGTELIVEDRADYVILRPTLEIPETRLEDVVGSAGYKGPRLSLDDMEAGIAEGARRRAR